MHRTMVLIAFLIGVCPAWAEEMPPTLPGIGDFPLAKSRTPSATFVKAQAVQAGQSLSSPALGLTNETQVVSGLQPGFNLVSFQVLPDNPTPDAVLVNIKQGSTVKTVSEAVEAVYAYDPQNPPNSRWRVWRPGSNENSIGMIGITKFDYHRGYWIKLKISNITISVTGKRSSDGRMFFSEGWNLLGFDIPTVSNLKLADIEQVFGPNIDTETPVNSNIDIIYAFDTTGKFVKYDVTNDRKMNDTNDGFLPPGNEGTPDPDNFTNFLAGSGYWIHVPTGKSFTLTPLLRTIVQSDSDVEPTGNFPGAEDIDIDGDRRIDKGTWVSDDPINPTPPTADDQTILLFKPAMNNYSLLLNNAGTGILNYNVSWTGGSWLTLDNLSGLLVASPGALNIKVDRTGLTGDNVLSGTLWIQSSGGSRSYEVRMQTIGLQGEFQGRANVKTVNGQKADLPGVDLDLNIFKASDGTQRGVIDSDLSLTMPIDIPMAGGVYQSGSNEFTLIGSYMLPPSTLNYDPSNASDMNPFLSELRREVTLIGDLARNDRLEGTYLETITGITPDPLRLEGTFTLNRMAFDPGKREGVSSTWTPAVQNGNIPDPPSILDRKINVSRRILVDRVEVYADITHPNMDELEAWLISPDPDGAGPLTPKTVKLLNRRPGVNLQAWLPKELFPADGATALNIFRNDLSPGDWTLRIKDNQMDTSGVQRLREWRINLLGPEVFEVTGRIIDQSRDNVPVEGAVVALTGGALVPSFTTGADGKFKFQLLTRHFYQLSASRPGYSSNDIRFYVDKDTAVGDVGITLDSCQAADLMVIPGRGVSPAIVTLRYVAPSLPSSATYTFTIQKVDRLNPLTKLGPPLTLGGIDPQVMADGLMEGVYDVGFTVSTGDQIMKKMAIDVSPNPAEGENCGAFRMVGVCFSSGGLLPAGFNPAGYSPPTNFSQREYMADCATFDNDRLTSGSHADFPQVEDTDTYPVPDIPPTTYALLPGDQAYDAPIMPEPDGQIWKNYRIFCNVGGSWFSGIGAGMNGAGGRGGDLHLVVGPGALPYNWTPAGGTNQ